jgi:hypothetical protein
MNAEHHLILHGLAIKKYASALDVASVVGVPADVASHYLQRQMDAGRVLRNAEKYSLAPTTRVALWGEYSRHYAAVREHEDFVAAYEAFEEINMRLKALITQWQVVEVRGAAVPNDHSDAAYDERVLGRLSTLHDGADRILARLARHLARFSIYREKLVAALERAEDGPIEWVSDVRIESYHTVWFELHEDLLCVMGRTRTE